MQSSSKVCDQTTRIVSCGPFSLLSEEEEEEEDEEEKEEKEEGVCLDAT